LSDPWVLLPSVMAAILADPVGQVWPHSATTRSCPDLSSEPACWLPG
jgi:hypothetical protein